MSLQITNQVFHADCMDLLPRIESKSIDMILTDLPYGVTNNSDDIPLDLNKLWLQFKRITKDNSPIVLTSQQPFTTDLINSNREMFRYDIIWDKEITSGFLNANRMPLRVHETILVFYNKLPIYNPQFSLGQKSHSKGSMKMNTNNNYGRFDRIDKTDQQGEKKYPKSIISFKRPHIESEHPTQKPVELFEYLIKTYSNENAIILDCCAGSGTTGIACKRTNRKYILVDKNRDYYNIILGNLSQQTLEVAH